MSTPSSLLTPEEMVEATGLLRAMRNFRTAASKPMLAYPKPLDAPHGLPFSDENGTVDGGGIGTRAGFKCGWEFGIAQCAVLFLPRGLPLDGEWATAVDWANRAINANLTKLMPGRGRNSSFNPLRYVAFNPAVIDEHNVLIRAAPDKLSINMDREWSPGLEYFVHLHDGQLKAAFLGRYDCRRWPRMAADCAALHKWLRCHHRLPQAHMIEVPLIATNTMMIATNTNDCGTTDRHERPSTAVTHAASGSTVTLCSPSTIVRTLRTCSGSDSAR